MMSDEIINGHKEGIFYGHSFYDIGSDKAITFLESIMAYEKYLAGDLNGAPGPSGEKGGKGDKGDQGLQGEEGPPGPIGPAGLVWKGQWEAETSYVTDDAVGYEGASYFCIAENQGDLPTNSPNSWALLASQGAQGQRGIQGLKGDKGDKGDTGDRGLQGAQGPKGDKGEKGETGAIGPQGPAGQNNTNNPVYTTQLAVSTSYSAIAIPNNPGVSFTIRKVGNNIEYSFTGNSIGGRYFDVEVVNFPSADVVKRYQANHTISGTSRYVVGDPAGYTGGGYKRIQFSARDWGDKNIIMIDVFHLQRQSDSNFSIAIRIETFKLP